MSAFDDLKRDARFAAQGIDDLDSVIGDVDLHDDELEDAFFIRQRLAEAKRILTDVTHQLDHKIGEAIGTERVTLCGKSVRRRAYVSRKKWDHEALEHAVLDSTLVDPETGEIKPETEAEKRAAVWPAKGYNASISALLARHVEPDEFCEHRFERWNLEVQ